MGLLKRVLREEEIIPEYFSGEYIDLSEYETAPEEYIDSSVRMQIRLGKIHRYEDLTNLTEVVYRGEILLLDFTAMSKDQCGQRQMFKLIKDLAKDVDGDVAGFGKDHLIICPSGVRVSRNLM